MLEGKKFNTLLKGFACVQLVGGKMKGGIHKNNAEKNVKVVNDKTVIDIKYGKGSNDLQVNK